jgi:hypothetical protein
VSKSDAAIAGLNDETTNTPAATNQLNLIKTPIELQPKQSATV